MATISDESVISDTIHTKLLREGSHNASRPKYCSGLEIITQKNRKDGKEFTLFVDFSC